jgi:hypothetical protein
LGIFKQGIDRARGLIEERDTWPVLPLMKTLLQL